MVAQGTSQTEVFFEAEKEGWAELESRERDRESVTWLQTGEEVAQGAPASRKKPLTNTNTNEI